MWPFLLLGHEPRRETEHFYLVSHPVGAECLALSRCSLSLSRTDDALVSLSFSYIRRWGALPSVGRNPRGWGNDRRFLPPFWKVIFRIRDQRRQLPSAGVGHLVAVIAVSPSPVVAAQRLQSEGNVGRVSSVLM